VAAELAELADGAARRFPAEVPAEDPEAAIAEIPPPPPPAAI
jgi:hypothetical protein